MVAVTPETDSPRSMPVFCYSCRFLPLQSSFTRWVPISVGAAIKELYGLVVHSFCASAEPETRQRPSVVLAFEQETGQMTAVRQWGGSYTIRDLTSANRVWRNLTKLWCLATIRERRLSRMAFGNLFRRCHSNLNEPRGSSKTYFAGSFA